MTKWLIVALVVVGDQVVKRAIQAAFQPAQSLPLIPHILHLTYVQNTGAAFGLFQGHPGVFVCVSIAVGLWVVAEFMRRARHGWPTDVALALILGGAIGNLIDRVRLGYVVDFLDLRVWPVFNLADSAITVGVTWLLWHMLCRTQGQGTRPPPPAPRSSDASDSL